MSFDNWSLEDVSSISSSDISNAINDISTDDNITFSSLSACSSNKDSKSAKKTKDSINGQSHHHHKEEQLGTQNPSPSFYQGAVSFNSLPSYYRADNWLQHFNNQGQMVYSTPLHGLERTDQMPSLSSKVGMAVGGDGKMRELLIPSAGIYIKKGGQACLVPADTRSRSRAKVPTFPHHMSGGTAVAIDVPLEEELCGNMNDVVRSLPNSGSVMNFSQHGTDATKSASFNKDTIRRYFYPIRDLPSAASNKTPSLLRQGLLGGPKKQQQQREGHVTLDRSQSCREQKDQGVEVTNERPLSDGTYSSEGGVKARQGSMPDSDSFENFTTFPFFTSSSIPRNWTIGGYGSSHFAGCVGLYDGQPLYQQLPYHLSRFNEFSPGNTLGRAESNLMSSATGGDSLYLWLHVWGVINNFKCPHQSITHKNPIALSL